MNAKRDHLRLVSHFPGRLRVRAETFRALPGAAEEVAARIAEEPGVTEVKTSPVTGSMLVLYEPRVLQLPRLVQALVRAGQQFPGQLRLGREHHLLGVPRLGDARAVVVFQLYQQPLHHLSGGLAGFPATEIPRYLLKQIFQQDTRLVIR